MKKIYLLFVAIFTVGCSSDAWYGDEKKLNVEGKRISILTHEQKFAKSEMSSAKIKIPSPAKMKEWTVSGANAIHLTGNLEFSKDAKQVWKRNIGEGNSSSSLLISEPLVHNGIAYAVDSIGQVSAYNLASGKLVWKNNFVKYDDDVSLVGSGLAFGGESLFFTSGLGDVMAVDYTTGKVKWKKILSSSIRIAPTYSGGYLYVITSDNNIYALDGATGTQKWRHTSVAQSTSLLGGAAPVITGGKLIAALSSGEILALNAKTGAFIWGEAVSGSSRLEGLSILMDIVARPVVKDGVVYVVGHSDVFVALDVNTGKKVWQRAIGSTTNPLIIDKYIFTITNDGDLIALEQKNGKVIWVRTLPSYIDEKDKEGKITWQGPIMLNSKLLIVGSYGEMAFLDPVNGDLLYKKKVSDGISISPVYADGNLIMLGDNADLMVFK